MIEIFFVLALLIAVLILFYRQAIEQYDILQIESTQISDLPKLLSERAPVVVRSIGQPKLLTPEVLKGNPRLLTFPLGKDLQLGSYLEKPTMQNFPLQKKSASILSNESGLHVWGEHTWFPKLFSSSFFESFYSFESEACIGEKGLRKTTALTTLLYPTAGTLEVCLLTEHQSKFLPKVWRGRFPETFRIQDTPLVGELKYITIKLRPGNLLCIPTHWYVSIRAEDPKQPCLWGWFELHHPISAIASKMESDLDA